MPPSLLGFPQIFPYSPTRQICFTLLALPKFLLPLTLIYNDRAMFELTKLQLETIERLLQAGFRPIAIPLYEKSICLYRGECVTILAPQENATFKLQASPTILVCGNLSVRLKKSTGDVFVWKKSALPATPERLAELESFRAELAAILDLPPKQ
jgi:hypothetical protein